KRSFDRTPRTLRSAQHDGGGGCNGERQGAAGSHPRRPGGRPAVRCEPATRSGSRRRRTERAGVNTELSHYRLPHRPIRGASAAGGKRCHAGRLPVRPDFRRASPTRPSPAATTPSPAAGSGTGVNLNVRTFELPPASSENEPPPRLGPNDDVSIRNLSGEKPTIPPDAFPAEKSATGHELGSNGSNPVSEIPRTSRWMRLADEAPLRSSFAPPTPLTWLKLAPGVVPVQLAMFVRQVAPPATARLPPCWRS